ncbi:MAG TPA: Gfo/Idh/MocA family oxidoreductase [Mycobacteriales bacterium]|nr:Gfo/Idh/MocA family oxidoreductase [Mycobacteriales bacterium]
MSALRVGLIGAGPWAQIAYVPMITGGPELELCGVWARRPQAAQELAEVAGTTAVESVEELFDRCEVIACAVPPAIQAGYAIQAAAAGKHLMLDKPLADSAERAEEVAGAIADAGVTSIVMFTSRFRPDVRELLDTVTDPTYAQLVNLNGAFLSGPFAGSPWRQQEGALLDWGPHGVDLLMHALGPVVACEATERGAVVSAVLHHEGGGLSQLLFGSRWPHEPVSRLDLVDAAGRHCADWTGRRAQAYQRTFATLREEFAASVRTGAAHPCDARRAADVQHVVDRLRRSARDHRE